MKPVKSTMKEKKRYFLIKFKIKNNTIITEGKTENKIENENIILDFKTKKNIILYNYKKLFGIVGLAKARLLFFDKKENYIIVRINLKEENNLRLTLLNIKEFEIEENKIKKKIKLTAYTKKVSGILKKVKEL